MSLAGMLLALIGPLGVRLLVSLGFTAVTFSGVTISANALIAQAQSSWSGISLTVLQLASLSGVPEFLGLTFGALAARLAMWSAVSAARYVLKI